MKVYVVMTMHKKNKHNIVIQAIFKSYEHAKLLQKFLSEDKKYIDYYYLVREGEIIE